MRSLGSDPFAKDFNKILQVMRSDGKEKTYSNDKVEKQNPPKYELLEDLANMTYLSEASVVYNLSERYVRFLIYTYSGKFNQPNPTLHEPLP